MWQLKLWTSSQSLKSQPQWGGQLWIYLCLVLFCAPLIGLGYSIKLKNNKKTPTYQVVGAPWALLCIWGWFWPWLLYPWRYLDRLQLFILHSWIFPLHNNITCVVLDVTITIPGWALQCFKHISNEIHSFHVLPSLSQKLRILHQTEYPIEGIHCLQACP